MFYFGDKQGEDGAEEVKGATKNGYEIVISEDFIDRDNSVVDTDNIIREEDFLRSGELEHKQTLSYREDFLNSIQTQYKNGDIQDKNVERNLEKESSLERMIPNPTKQLIVPELNQLSAGNKLVYPTELKREIEFFTLTGEVIAASDGKPLPDVDILEIGTVNSGVTDLYGQFSLDVSSVNTSILVSLEGYESQTVDIENKLELTITLVEESEDLYNGVILEVVNHDNSKSKLAAPGPNYKEAVASLFSLIKGGWNSDGAMELTNYNTRGDAPVSGRWHYYSLDRPEEGYHYVRSSKKKNSDHITDAHRWEIYSQLKADNIKLKQAVSEMRKALLVYMSKYDEMDSVVVLLRDYGEKSNSLDVAYISQRLERQNSINHYAIAERIYDDFDLLGEDNGLEELALNPNPFNPTTSFQLRVAQSQNVKIEVYDMLGRLVSLIHDGELSENQAHLFSFDASTLASGRYLLRATGEHFVKTKNLTVVN